MGSAISHQLTRFVEGEVMTIVTIGIDLAKNVFAVHGVDATGKPALVRPSVARAKLLELVASLPACLIGMEACSGAHHWAREFQKFGHTVRLIAPKFVIPYQLAGKRGKNDAADAAAICEAVPRPKAETAAPARNNSGTRYCAKTATDWIILRTTTCPISASGTLVAISATANRCSTT
jgi:hypothetical protein